MSPSTHPLLSPASSTTSAGSSNVKHSKNLPLSRTHPLKPGSQKEITLINYVDDKILRITRRYAKKYSNSPNDADDTKGYVSFDEVVHDLDAIFQVVWISGTPTLQVPYLLTLAGLFASYMSAFPFSRGMFGFVRKLDEGFAYLLRDQAGSMDHERIYHVTTTDKVRIKSLAEETRVVAVDVATESGQSLSLDEDDSDDDEHDEEEEEEDDEMPDQVSISLSKIYKRTIDLLGDSLV